MQNRNLKRWGAKYKAPLKSALRISLLLGVLILLKPAGTGATVNRQINFQGKIVLSSNSTNITNGTYNMEFNIYSGGDGVPGGGDETLLWTEARLRNNSQGVTITDGIFQVNLGAVTTLPGSVDFNNSTLWLSMNLGNTNPTCSPFSSCSGDGEMNPMVRFTAAPYAFNSDLLDGLDSTAFAQLSGTNAWAGTNTFNSQATFNTDVDYVFTGTENISVTSDLAGTVDVLSVVATPSASAGTTQGILVQQANSANSNGLDNGITIDNADTNLAITAALKIQNSGGGGYTTIIDNQGTLISGTELNLLDTHDVALVDTNDAVTTAITGTGALNAGSITSGFGAIDVGTENISTTGTVSGNNIDRTSAGALTVGNTNATSVSVCNGAACDTVQIGTNADADTITVGDSTDTIGINGTTTVTGATTVTGTTLINSTGTASTTIGNSSGGTITLGASSGSDLILSDAQWSVTGAGAASFASVNAGSGTIQTTSSVLGNNFDRTTAGAIGVGNTTATSLSLCNSAACDALTLGTNADADTISIGDGLDTLTLTGSSASTLVFNGTTLSTTELNLLDGKDAALVDQNDFISSDGTGATSSGSGLESGTGGIGLIQGCANNEILKWNEASSVWACGSSNYKKFTSVASTNVVNDTNNTADQAMTDVDVTTQTSATATDVLVSHNFDYTVQTAGDAWTAHIAPNGSTVGQDNIVSFLGDNDSTLGTLGNGGQTIVGLDGNQIFEYGLNEIVDGATVTFRINVIGYWDEVTTGADLAENYYTRDGSIRPGDVICFDPTLASGVQKCNRAYDSNAIGVVSTQPGIVLDDIYNPSNGLTNLTGEYKDRVPVAVALAGRVPVKVSIENGPIKFGDYLTPSSIPGVAMKAAKAGKVLGQALFGHDRAEAGAVMMFVSNQNTLGASLEEIFPGLSEDITGANFGQRVLTDLIADKTAVVSSEFTSEVFTDRIAAGLEIVTPQLTTDTVRTNTITASTTEDLTILISDGGELVLKGPDGARTITFDGSGNADFAGNIVAGGGLVVQGPAQFNGESIFDKLVTFSDDVIFKGNVTFNNNTGGYALIKEGEQEVEVKFAKKAGEVLPIVTVNIKNGHFVPYAYQELTEEGFKIVLNQPASGDIEFVWTALTIEDPQISQSPETLP